MKSILKLTLTFSIILGRPAFAVGYRNLMRIKTLLSDCRITASMKQLIISLREIAEPLKKEEMKLVLGGSVYRCCCGSGSHIACYEDIDGENSSEAVYGFVTDYCDRVHEGIYQGIGGCFFN